MNKKAVSLLILTCLLTLTIVTVQPTWGTEASWETKTPMQAARSRLGVAVVDGKIYAIGGDDTHLSGNCIGPSIGTLLNTTEMYDPAADAWVFKASMPTARCSFGVAVYQGKIYCIGGATSYNTQTGANEVYDPATDTWETKTAMPTARMELQANVVDGKIYLIGGSNSYGGGYLAVNEVYDPATDTWTTKTPAPYSFTSGASAVVGGKIYLLAKASRLDLGAFIQIYNPADDSWSVGAAAPTYGGISASAGVASGGSGSERILFFDESSTSIYTPATDSWAVGTGMPSHRGFPGVAFVNGVFYVVGGIPAPFQGYIVITASTAANEQYTPNESLPVSADPKIYIRADGSIESASANLTTTDHVVYTFTANNHERLVVKRDNIILDGNGYTLQGEDSFGITLFQRTNVTIRNLTVRDFQSAGIGMEYSTQNTIVGNTLYNNLNDGIRTLGACNNVISGNNITSNTYMSGIRLEDGSDDNVVSGNNVLQNSISFIIWGSSGNLIYHNNVEERFQDPSVEEGYANTWDNGSEGNYWSIYNGTDANGDGIGDTPFVIDADNQDNYPLMAPLDLPEETPEPTPTPASTSPTPSPTASPTPPPSQTSQPTPTPSASTEPAEPTGAAPSQTTNPTAPTAQPENPQSNDNLNETGDSYWIAAAVAIAVTFVIAAVIVAKKRR